MLLLTLISLMNEIHANVPLAIELLDIMSLPNRLEKSDLGSEHHHGIITELFIKTLLP
jgi:hypothetical protein